LIVPPELLTITGVAQVLLKGTLNLNLCWLASQALILRGNSLPQRVESEGTPSSSMK